MFIKAISALFFIVCLSACGGGGSGGGSGGGAASNENPIDTSGPGTPPSPAPVVNTGKKILMFVSYNDVWYAEYKVMYEALLAMGYSIDVVSASNSTNYATTYHIGGNIEASANSDPSGDNYPDFTSSFMAKTGQAWQSSWNDLTTIPISGRIQDIASMDEYAALVAPGGIGMRDYVLDGSYNSQNDVATGGHTATAAEVQAAAEKFAALTIDALQAGKPVLSQCHGAKNVAFVRVPGSVSGGFDGLGESIMAGRDATGFHIDGSAASNYQDGETGVAYNSLGVDYLPYRRVVIDGPSASQLGGDSDGLSKVVTTRDWYPQTVLAASKTLDNMLNSYPQNTAQSVNVLVVHGGPVNTGNCSHSNQTSNDVPCNFLPNMPADHTDLESLLSASTTDGLSMTVQGINILANNHINLPFNIDDPTSTSTYLSSFDVVVFYKHWANGMTAPLQNALLDFVDSGKGMIAIHHGLYNQSPAKDILVNAFEVHSDSSDWDSRDPDNGSFALLNLNPGHFVSSYHLNYNPTPNDDAIPAAPSASNENPWGAPTVNLTDEIYTNTSYLPSASFGEGTGQINILFANDYLTALGQTKTAGSVKTYNPSADDSVGRLGYFQLGERPENYQTDSFYGQVLRNAVYWAGRQ